MQSSSKSSPRAPILKPGYENAGACEIRSLPIYRRPARLLRIIKTDRLRPTGNYVPTQNGSTVVFKPDPDHFELLAENELGEPSNSTLAISDGQIFLRTFQNLYCIGEK